MLVSHTQISPQGSPNRDVFKLIKISTIELFSEEVSKLALISPQRQLSRSHLKGIIEYATKALHNKPHRFYQICHKHLIEQYMFTVLTDYLRGCHVFLPHGLRQVLLCQSGSHLNEGNTMSILIIIRCHGTLPHGITHIFIL